MESAILSINAFHDRTHLEHVLEEISHVHEFLLDQDAKGLEQVGKNLTSRVNAEELSKCNHLEPHTTIQTFTQNALSEPLSGQPELDIDHEQQQYSSISETLQRNTLHKLPPEIRLIIFEDVLAMQDKPVRKDGRDWLGRPRLTPPLLIALRADQPMYQEALEIYYSKNLFTICIHNFTTARDDLLPHVLSLIRNLKIELYVTPPGYGAKHSKRCSDYEDFIDNFLDDRDTRLSFLCGLGKLIVQVGSQRCLYQSCDRKSRAFHLVRRLLSLSTGVDELTCYLEDDTESEGVQEELDTVMNVKGVRLEVPSNPGSRTSSPLLLPITTSVNRWGRQHLPKIKEAERWKWSAEHGKALQLCDTEV
ncbi:hypothetical protein B0O99DRAFT_684506 [Bisporella sp. PMI_857]|nr:hypothetical protein B0O99DRAFT_684506 [Bisporella sp. PMI_857]